MKTQRFDVTGMTCAACQANVTRRVKKLEGVKQVEVDLLSGRMRVEYDETAQDEARICAAVEEIGYGATPQRATPAQAEKSGFRSQWQERQKRAQDDRAAMKRRLTASIALLVPLMYVAMGEMMRLPLPGFLRGTPNALVSALTQLVLTLPVLLINRRFYTSGFKALVHRAPNMDSLVAIGSAASLAYGVFSMYRMAYGFGHGDEAVVHQYAHALYFESAAMILTLVTVGKYLEARSKSKTSDALGKLVDLAPKTAVVVRDGQEVSVPAEQVVAGDVVVIRPGQSIPVDGVVVEGYGFVDQAAITGESVPVEKREGDEVISATINKNGSFRFRASRVGNDTTLSQIIRLVDEAGSTKAPIARMADKVSGVFVPVVMAVAVLTALVWLIAGYGFEFALSNAISVLVISCPCALGLATPVAILVGTGKAAEFGILVKSAEALENLHSVDTIVLDKTGTITSGHPSVTDVVVLDAGLDRDAFLAQAAALERGSEHPLAAAVVEYARAQGVAARDARDFSAHSGRGVRAVVDGRPALAGNAAFLEENGVDVRPAAEHVRRLAAQGKTPLLFSRDGRLCGVIAVADTVRSSSLAAIGRFKKMGLRVVMLTGDNRHSAQAVREQLGIDEAIAEVLPTQKEAAVRRLQAEGRKVAMVGDGINDAPALMRADIGIAIGAGTDIAIDSADVVLMKDSLMDVVTAIELSRAVIRNIHMNLFWAFFYNILGIPVAAGALFSALGLRLSPMIGSAAMSLSSVCVVTNALRLRLFKRHEQPLDESSPPRHDPAPCAGVNNPGDAPEKKGQISMKKVLNVQGMMCAHCKAHVEKALVAVDGVTAAEADLENKTATVTLEREVDAQALVKAVQDAGYEAELA